MPPLDEARTQNTRITPVPPPTSAIRIDALADDDPNQLGRFVAPQFRVHPELQKLARSVFEQHPSALRQIKAQTRRR